MVIRMNAMLPLPQPQGISPLVETRAEAEMADAMMERLRTIGRRSTSEMLQELRREFPHSPLALRVRALEALRGL
jgi:hypothetical protein